MIKKIVGFASTVIFYSFWFYAVFSSNPGLQNLFMFSYGIIQLIILPFTVLATFGVLSVETQNLLPGRSNEALGKELENFSLLKSSFYRIMEIILIGTMVYKGFIFTAIPGTFTVITLIVFIVLMSQAKKKFEDFKNSLLLKNSN